VITTRRITAALASSRGLFVTAVLAGSLCGLGFLGVGGASHTMTARFSDASGLVVGNEVRIAGVAAGSVTSVAIGTDPSTGHQFAKVEMEIDAGHWPLYQGTKVAVKPKGVLSNVFVEVDSGSPHNPPLGDHPFFDLSRTQSPINLDALSNVFTPDVRTAIRTQLQEGVLAFGGTGTTDLNATLVNANPLTLDAIPVTAVLATRSPQLDNLNFEFDTISGDLAREDANLRPLIASLDTTMGALAVRQAELQGTLVHAANVFGDLSQALNSSTTQADLARIFQQGPQSLACASAIANYITPLVTAVNPYISSSAPYSLDTLLADFVTASGYNTLTERGTVVTSGDALRVLPSAVLPPPPPSDTFHDAGGLTVAHAGYTNAQLNGSPVYAEQPPLTGASTHPTLSGCTPPAGLP
jgi:phospholipid/cholesterol/gamma-HCH transport system substrate-binding protein